MVEIQHDADMPKAKAWPPGHRYGLPCICKTATGQKRMKYMPPERAVSYKPHKVYRPPELPMPDGTTYKLSYESFDPQMIRNCRGKPTFAKENLVNAGEFSDKTTHKMSYGAWPGVTRPKMVYPKDHKLAGIGPLSEMTTHRHDYVPKPLDNVNKIIQPDALGLSKAKMAGDSVMMMSYKNPDLTRFSPAQSFKPEKKYLPPDSPLDGETVHKLSYMPWEPQAKMETPWAAKDKYEKPQIPMDGNTIYNGSYIPPGRLTEDQSGHCMGCYCLYPGECFDTQGEPPRGALICPDGYNPVNDPPRPEPITDPAAVPEIVPVSAPEPSPVDKGPSGDAEKPAEKPVNYDECPQEEK